MIWFGKSFIKFVGALLNLIMLLTYYESFLQRHAARPGLEREVAKNTKLVPEKSYMEPDFEDDRQGIAQDNPSNSGQLWA